MKAKLPNVQKPKLITLCQINGQQLHKAILCCSERLLYLMATTTNLGFLGEFKVHLLYRIFEKGVVSGRCHISDHVLQSIKDEQLGCCIYFAVLHAKLGHTVWQLPWVNLEGQTAFRYVLTRNEEWLEIGIFTCLTLGFRWLIDNLSRIFDTLFQQLVVVGRKSFQQHALFRWAVAICLLKIKRGPTSFFGFQLLIKLLKYVQINITNPEDQISHFNDEEIKNLSVLRRIQSSR